jgi:cytosine/adenosine deaminase-related metal-dependent hydrolase
MIYQNGTIVTVDDKRRVIEDGAIAVQGGRIVAVGKRESVISAFPQDLERVDLGDGLVIPGLVNTHVHLSQALIRGCADDLALIDWLTKRVWVLQGNYTQEDGRLSAELCILEMLKSGTTSFIETMIAGHYGFDGIAQVVEGSGIRAALSKIVMDLPSYASEEGSMHPGMIEDPKRSFQEALAMHEKWDGAVDGRIQVWFGPRPPGGSTSELYRKMMAAARQKNMGVTVHLAEVKEDVGYIRNEYGMSAVEYARSVGMLGPRVVLVHVVWVGEDEIAILAETGTHVSHNPLSNSKLASGIAPIPEMLKAGVNVGLGTDGGPSSNDYDMIRAMRWASYLHKVRLGDPTIMPCEQVFEMATLGGARAMGLEDQIGSLEVGKRADFVVIDMNKPHLTPAPDPISTLLCAGTGKDVRMVVIDGKIIVREGAVLTMDEDRILAEARERAHKLYQRAGIEFRPRWRIE